MPGWQRALVTIGAIAFVFVVGSYLTRPAFRFIAVARLRDNQHDLALLDVMLPGIQGWDVLEAIRAFRRCLEIDPHYNAAHYRLGLSLFDGPLPPYCPVPVQPTTGPGGPRPGRGCLKRD